MQLPDNALTGKSRGLAGGRWWRWTKYQLLEGCLRPAPDAVLRCYDPFGTRPAGRSSAQAGKNSTPYLSLLEMLRSLKYVDNEDFSPAEIGMPAGRLTAESEQAILNWCDRYGLLGVLPHRISQMTLNPKDDQQRQYIRIGIGWMEIVRDTRNPLTTAVRPNATVLDLRGVVPLVEPLSTTLARFFPAIPVEEQETYEYPQPLSDRFWKLYAEPLQDFLSAARVLREILTALRFQRSFRLRHVHAALTGGPPIVISALMAPIGVGAQMRRGSVRSIDLVSGSLLASLTLMLLEDLAGARALQCPCGRLFMSRAYQARYCSKRCRWRFEQRGFRKRSRSTKHM